MESRIILSLLSILIAMTAVSCGENEQAKSIQEFRIKSIQHQICIVKNGDIQERCEEFEKQQVFQVQVIEDVEKRVWLTGIERDGETSRQILGSRDQDGGYLFIDQVIDKNEDNGCELTRRLTLSLKSDQKDTEDGEIAKEDPCKALIGRETLEVKSSSACDENIESPAQYTRYIRKRWERDGNCGKDS